MALDKISIPILVEAHKTKGTPWAICGHEDDCTTAIAIKAAVSGKSHHITYCAISMSVSGQVFIQDEDDNLIFAVAGAANGAAGIGHEFKHPVQMVANKALELKQSDAGACTVYVEGYTV